MKLMKANLSVEETALRRECWGALLTPVVGLGRSEQYCSVAEAEIYSRASNNVLLSYLLKEMVCVIVKARILSRNMAPVIPKKYAGALARNRSSCQTS
jgi:hypothetical protein